MTKDRVEGLARALGEAAGFDYATEENAETAGRILALAALDYMETEFRAELLKQRSENVENDREMDIWFNGFEEGLTVLKSFRESAK